MLGFYSNRTTIHCTGVLRILPSKVIFENENKPGLDGSFHVLYSKKKGETLIISFHYYYVECWFVFLCNLAQKYFTVNFYFIFSRLESFCPPSPHQQLSETFKAVKSPHLKPFLCSEKYNFNKKIPNNIYKPWVV